MAFSADICKLVIGNIELLEDAPNVISEIENKVFKEINARIKSYIDGNEGWKDGVYTYFDEDDGETTFAPTGWPEDEEGNYTAWYGFNRKTGEGYKYNLSALVGKTPLDNYGIFFGVDNNSMGMKKNQWKNFLSNQYINKPILQENGVIYDGLLLYIPITLDPKLIAEEYPLFDACLKPVDDALDILVKVNPDIHGIVKELENLGSAAAPSSEA